MVQATAAQRRPGSQGNRTRARTSRWQVNRHKRHNHEEVGARLRLIGDSPAPTCARKGESLRLPFNAIPILTVITAVAAASGSILFYLNVGNYR